MDFDMLSTTSCKWSQEKKARKKSQESFEKRELYENCQKQPYTKIVTLGRKLKMHKNVLKTFLQHIAVVLSKKRLEKTANIGKMRAF